MTNKEILKKSLQKAVLNGYLKSGVTSLFYLPLEKTCKNEAHFYYETESYYQIIFSHDFAKAFWGEELTKAKYSHKVKGKGIEKLLNGKNIQTDVEEIWYIIELPCWEFHLREMVLEEKPLKYLEKFLDNS